MAVLRRVWSAVGVVVVVMAAAAMGQERLPAPPPPPPPEGAPSTPALERLLDDKGRVTRVETGLAAADGLVWTDDGVLVLTDAPRGQILRWTPGSGIIVDHGDSGGAAGLALDRAGRLLIAERRARRVTRVGPGGAAIVVDLVDGEPLAGPTDVVVARGGAVYVADPRAAGGRVILVDPSGGASVAARDMVRPSGLALSLDEKTLYVSDAAKAELRSYPIGPGGRLGAGRRLASIEPWKHGVYGRPDGLTLDREGRLYLAGPGGIWVLDANGGRLGVIATSETPSACAFGDADRKTLYFTAESSVYRVRLTVAGVRQR